MRVLFIGPNLGAGGAERQLSILAPRLRALGFDARVIALDAGGPFAEPLRRRGVPVEVVDMRHQADLRRLVRCPLIRAFAPDVVVSRTMAKTWHSPLRSMPLFCPESRRSIVACDTRALKFCAIFGYPRCCSKPVS
jgi:hypothetical protein